MTEEWYCIPDTEYDITKSGKIRRICENGKIRYLKGGLNNDGYRVVNFRKKCYYVHRILGQLFIPNPENKPCIDHINRIRNDNRICNLRWATRRENNYNQIQKGCVSKTKSGWQAIIIDLDSKRHTKRFKKKEDAEKWRDENLIQR